MTKSIRSNFLSAISFIILQLINQQQCFSENNLSIQTTENVRPTFYTNVVVENAPFTAVEVENPTLYDTLTQEEINMLEVTIQNEVGAFSVEYKTLIAELIYNRLISDEFPNTVEEVLFQTGQFQGINQWYYSGIFADEDTKQVIKEVFTSENPSHECTYYYNPELSSYEAIMWFEYSGDVNYEFSFSESDWGIEYETRFFK